MSNGQARGNGIVDILTTSERANPSRTGMRISEHLMAGRDEQHCAGDDAGNALRWASSGQLVKRQAAFVPEERRIWPRNHVRVAAGQREHCHRYVCLAQNSQLACLHR